MTAKPSRPIRRRLVLAVTGMVLAVALLGGLVFNLAAFEIEDDLFTARLELELDALVADHAAGRQPLVAGSRLMQVGIDGAGLPPVVATRARALGPGLHEIFDLDVGDGSGPHDLMLGVRELSDGSQLVVWYQTWLLEEGEDSQFWRLILGVGIPLGLAALAWMAIAALSNLVFHPLKSLAAAVAQREEGEALFAPLRDRFAADEIGAIAGVFDEHLTRIRAVTERERRFTRDASHELRTPLAVITAALDCLPLDSLSLAQQRSVGRIRRACARMQRLIDAFLLLARNEDASDCTATPAEIVHQLDLPEMAAVEIDPVLAEVQVAWADLVVVILDNLVRNAQSHGAGGLTIRWTSGGIRVTNTIDPDRPVPPDVLASGSRGQASDGFGLGLGIVRHLAERIAWQVRVTTSSDGFSVQLGSDVQAEQAS